VATLIGFITLFGIATRNGIMLVTHIHHLHDEGFHGAEAIRRAALERLSPILMTALTAGLALVPIILRRHAPGSEIQAPMAFVILFGLISSTALNMLVVPSLYLRFGSKVGHPHSTEGTLPDQGTSQTT
jgi:Cu/Ag efflux pump CusA